MRIISYFRTETKTPRNGAPALVCRTPLVAGLFALLMSLIAFPVNAQSYSLSGCRLTDSQFLDRLKAHSDWQVGLDFPLFSDSTTCGFELRVVEQSSQESSNDESADLELEILRSVCELLHLDPCEAYAHLWAPPVQRVKANSPTAVQIDRAQVVRWIDGAYEIGLGLASAAMTPFERLNREIDTYRDDIRNHKVLVELTSFGHSVVGKLSHASQFVPSTFSNWTDSADKSNVSQRYRQGWSDLATNLLGLRGYWEVQRERFFEWVGNMPVDVSAVHWAEGAWGRASEIGSSAKNITNSWLQEPPIQPIPTASYIGLHRAIDRVMQSVGVQIRVWKNRGHLAVHGAARLTELQNAAFERIVLEQFDAILR
ncbi:MAG: hypothetical protein JNL67_06645 [Planctomycetaceae bacterium]|nr:hypothetical protein [Planctomycetaceae bacterium]